MHDTACCSEHWHALRLVKGGDLLENTLCGWTVVVGEEDSSGKASEDTDVIRTTPAYEGGQFGPGDTVLRNTSDQGGNGCNCFRASICAEVWFDSVLTVSSPYSFVVDAW